jgi:hypothetical protein
MEAVPYQAKTLSGLDAHTQNFIDVVKSRSFTNLSCSVEAGAHVAKVCQMGNISYRTGKIVHWDASRDKFAEKQANKYLSAKYHNQYEIPRV